MSSLLAGLKVVPKSKKKAEKRAAEGGQGELAEGAKVQRMEWMMGPVDLLGRRRETVGTMKENTRVRRRWIMSGATPVCSALSFTPSCACLRYRRPQRKQPSGRPPRPRRKRFRMTFSR
jgi:hypothetical protein